MIVTENDIQILALLARYYVLTREQIQRLSAPHLVSGRSLRRRITKLRQDDYLFRHRVPVALPGKNGAAPVYYLTKKGTELLASWFDDDALSCHNTSASSPRPVESLVCHH